MPFQIHDGLENANHDLIRQTAQTARETALAAITANEEFINEMGESVSPLQYKIESAQSEIAILEDNIQKNPERQRPYILDSDEHVSADEAIRIWTEQKSYQERIVIDSQLQEHAMPAQIARMEAIERSPSDAIILTIQQDTSRDDVSNFLKKVELAKKKDVSPQQRALLGELSEKLDYLKKAIDSTEGVSSTLQDMHIALQLSEVKFLKGLNVELDEQIKPIVDQVAVQETARANALLAEIVTGLEREANLLRSKGHPKTATLLQQTKGYIDSNKSKHDTAESVYKSLDTQLTRLSDNLKNHEEVSHGFRKFFRNAMNKVKAALGMKQSQAVGIENIQPENLVNVRSDAFSFAFEKFKTIQRQTSASRHAKESKHTSVDSMVEEEKPSSKRNKT